MAFTSQKDLFLAPKQLEPAAKTCSKVLSIVSCRDFRSWAGPELRASFLLDLVHRSNGNRGGGDSADMFDMSDMSPQELADVVRQLKGELKAKNCEICRLECQLKEQKGGQDTGRKSQQDAQRQIESKNADLSKENQRLLAEMRSIQDSGQQCDELLRERDRLRQQLDKLTGLEDQLVSLQQRARNCDQMEHERDELQRQFVEQSGDLARLRFERDSSLTSLQKKNRELVVFRESVLDQRGSKERLSEERLRLTENQLGTAEAAIAEYEHDIEVQIATIVEYEQNAQQRQSTIAALTQRLSASQLSHNASEQRLRALDDLETDVSTLQEQLTVALAHQRNQQMTDLVGAVKLTLLYVQNKLTSRETVVDDQTELERLKAELLNLREPQRSSQMLQQQALEGEIERLQRVVNATGARDQAILQLTEQQSQSVHNGVSLVRRQLTTVRVGLRRQLTQAKRDQLQLQSNARLAIADQQSTIEGLQQHVERSSIQLSNREQDLEAQLQELRLENETLREQINILNCQMDELGVLVAEIEKERAMNTGLQGELTDFEKALTQLQSDDVSRGSKSQLELTDVQYSVDDALRKCTDQLEAEGSKCQALEEQVQCLLEEVRVLNEKLQWFVERSSELELAEKSKKERAAAGADGLDDLEKICEGDYGKIACPCKGGRKMAAADAQGRMSKPNAKEVQSWRKFCEKIMAHGIESFNLRELSDLHQLVYMAGLRYTQMNAAANNPTGHYPKEERQFYERKGLEHQQKVHELQHQLHDIRNGLAAIRDVRCHCQRAKGTGSRRVRSKSAK